MPKAPIVSALLVKDEADHYLKEVLDACGEFSELVILDDGSTDATGEICQAHPRLRAYQRREGPPAWGRESPARQELWDLAREHGDWVLFCDADQLLVGDPRDLIQSVSVNAWSFILYDLWDARTTYRDDGYWRGHLVPRPWLVCPDRVPGGWRAKWNGRGIHTGHLPSNFPLIHAVAPPDRYHWLHLGYVDKKDRETKLAKYRSVGGQLTDFERLHAESIVSKPSLKRLPSETPIRILVGGPVRKPVEVLQAHLASLEWQELPPRVGVGYCFVADYPQPDPAEDLLKAFTAQRIGSAVIFPNTRPPANDFSDTDPVTHQWTQTAMGRVAAHKHLIFQYALEHNYDYVWLVDSDVLCDRTTLASLLSCGKAVATAVYWTRWNTSPQIHAAPQVWLKPVYELSKGPYYPEWLFRKELAERQLTRVGGLGACTLIHRHVVEKGVNFTKPPNFPTGGLWDGEDRHFCEWARRLHVELWADPWPDIFHVYHASDVSRIPERMASLGGTHSPFPHGGDLVSLKLTCVEEPVGTEYFRGRLHAGALLPDLEDAVLRMRRGEQRLVRVLYPVSFEYEPLRGQARLIDVTLVDCKPFGLAPVLEDEFHRSDLGVTMDATNYTPAQHQLLVQANG